MSNAVCNPARVRQLDAIIAEELAGGTVHLFTNDITPNEDTILGDFDEPTAAWYAPQTLNAWAAAALVGDIARTTHPAKTFEHDGGVDDETVYGHFVKNAAGQYVYGSRRAGGAVNVVPGTAYVAKPVYDLTQP